MSVYLRREVDTKESSLIRRSINKVGVTSLFVLKERKYLNNNYRRICVVCVWCSLKATSSLSFRSEIVKEKKNKRVSTKSIAARQVR